MPESKFKIAVRSPESGVRGQRSAPGSGKRGKRKQCQTHQSQAAILQPTRPTAHLAMAGKSTEKITTKVPGKNVKYIHIEGNIYVCRVRRTGEIRRKSKSKKCTFGKNGKRCQMQIDSFQYQFQNNRWTAREGNEMPANEVKSIFPVRTGAAKWCRQHLLLAARLSGFSLTAGHVTLQLYSIEAIQIQSNGLTG